jgi:hypothetical protein
LNKLLEIKHVTGAAYHPQSQAMVESMHKMLNLLVRGLVQEHPEKWEKMLPLAECILRIIPLKALGGRCAYEVVTGMKPKLPSALDPALKVEYLTLSDYCEKLREHFKDSHKQIERVQAETAEEAGDDAQGHLSKELFVGDLVLVRREPNVRREGPLRFQSRVYPLVYKILKKISRHTFVVGDVADPKRELPFAQPLNAEG